MQNDYNWIYSNDPWWIADEGSYFAVYYEAKHIASFKDKDDAFEYVAIKLYGSE